MNRTEQAKMLLAGDPDAALMAASQSEGKKMADPEPNSDVLDPDMVDLSRSDRFLVQEGDLVITKPGMTEEEWKNHRNNPAKKKG